MTNQNWELVANDYEDLPFPTFNAKYPGWSFDEDFDRQLRAEFHRRGKRLGLDAVVAAPKVAS